MERVIGIGECTASNNAEDSIKTYALASCVAVTAYSPARKLGGMVHIVLPSITDNKLSQSRPGYFAVTGIPLLINKLCNEYGCLKSELVINIYGGADSANKKDIFNIGKRNIEAVKNVLSGLNLNVNISDVGGNISRTIQLDLSTGRVKITTQPISI